MEPTQTDSQRKVDPAVGAGLNPNLKREHDPAYGAAYQGTDFMKSVSVQKEEGRAWPMIWAVSIVICVVVTVLILVF